jgi:hypothetical protein
MTKKIGNTGRIRRTTVLAARLWVVALALAVATMALYSRAGTDEAAARNGASSSEEEGSDGGRSAGETFLRTELYFGSGKPGADVTKEQSDRFVDGEVTPRFPEGLTSLAGYGQFKGSDGEIVEERSFVLILLYPPDDEEANGEIEEIRAAYERAFEQESVLRVDSREQVSF